MIVDLGGRHRVREQRNASISFRKLVCRGRSGSRRTNYCKQMRAFRGIQQYKTLDNMALVKLHHDSP